MASKTSRGSRRIAGPFIYEDYRDNHAIWPGTEVALNKFLDGTFKGRNHKKKNARSSNSEDALTWSCFNTLANVSHERRAAALEELWELAFDGLPEPPGLAWSEISTGKTYGKGQHSTEVDLSFEGQSFLIFVEAKLYSPMSQSELDPDTKKNKRDDQIVRKLTIGLHEAKEAHKDFYFILLDIAPCDCLRKLSPRVKLSAAKKKAPGFRGKWVTAYWFSRYKGRRGATLTPLRQLLREKNLDASQASQIADQMGWLTWADVFKVVLRAVIREMAEARYPSFPLTASPPDQ
jgi:hypothetical protein